jgi:hypothetical protein
MTILKTKNGYEISMQSYIEDTLQLYAKKLTEYVTPTKPNLFKVNPEAELIKEKAKFHSIVAKLLYLANEDVQTSFYQFNSYAHE